MKRYTSLYIPASFATQSGSIAGFWATSIDSSGNANDYPIVEFQGPTTTGYYPNGGVAGFYGWDNASTAPIGAYVSMGLPAGFKYNSWVQITMTLIPGSGIQYSVTDFAGGTVAVTTGVSDPADVDLANVILEGYNYGSNYSFYWNGLSASYPSALTNTNANSCQGVFTGTFKGNVNVYPPNPCILMNATIEGNIQQNGGSLVLYQSEVTGNVQTQGGGSVMIGPSTAIIGNLSIQNIPAGSGADSVCGSKIDGNFTFQNNGVPVEIGNNSPGAPFPPTPCAGNYIFGNLQVQNNTAPVVIDNNTVEGNLQAQNNTALLTIDGDTVAKDLQDTNNTGGTQLAGDSAGGNFQCQNNTTITGGHDSGALQGQCSGFGGAAPAPPGGDPGPSVRTASQR